VAGSVVAVDGETLRRSFAPASDRAAIHMGSAWSANQGTRLGQLRTAEKSNEITAISLLLPRLKRVGAVVTIDAMSCQRKITAAIREGRADCVGTVKDNQPTLYRSIKDWFDASAALPTEESPLVSFTTTGSGQGRDEQRTAWIRRRHRSQPRPPRGRWALLVAASR
jgi:predicted transposase YbfD/YdcC